MFISQATNGTIKVNTIYNNLASDQFHLNCVFNFNSKIAMSNPNPGVVIRAITTDLDTVQSSVVRVQKPTNGYINLYVP